MDYFAEKGNLSILFDNWDLNVLKVDPMKVVEDCMSLGVALWNTYS
jgi:hypothetical protein